MAHLRNRRATWITNEDAFDRVSKALWAELFADLYREQHPGATEGEIWADVQRRLARLGSGSQMAPKPRTERVAADVLAAASEPVILRALSHNGHGGLKVLLNVERGPFGLGRVLVYDERVTAEPGKKPHARQPAGPVKAHRSRKDAIAYLVELWYGPGAPFTMQDAKRED
jgi:hypothetical protein